MFHVLKGVVTVVALSLMAASGWADDIPIVSPGFTQFFLGWSHEYSGIGGDGSGLNDTVDTGWFSEPANAGLSDQLSAIVCCGNASYTQELGVNYQSNMLYTLQFDVGVPDRAPDSFRTLDDYHVKLIRGGILQEGSTLGVWDSGVTLFDANSDTFGELSTTAGAGGVWKHVTAQWSSGNLPQEVLDSPIQIRMGPASVYGIFDNIQLSVEPAPPGVEGDYNDDGVVDAADYVTWRRGGPLANEVADPGTVSPADYDEWRARFGNTSGSGSGTGTLTRVPEPASALLAMLASMPMMIARRRVSV